MVETLEARLCLAAGALDKSFGGDGMVLTKFTGPNDDYATAVVIQDDGKAVVAGRTVGVAGGGGSQFLLVRFNPNGTLDKSFGKNGVAYSNYDFADDTGGFGANATDLALQDNGKIVVAGFFGPNFAAARFNADGAIDKKFADGGVFRIQAHSTGSSFAGAVAIRSDGRIVLGGQARVGEGAESNIDSTLVQLTRRGALDTSFGDGGIVRYDLGFRDDDRIYDLTLDADGKIVVVGEVGFNDQSRAFLARFNPDGSIDTPFGFDGQANWGTDFVADRASAVLVLDDERIVVTGSSGGDLVVRAYEPDGHLDTDFGNEGRITRDLGSSFDAGADVVAEADDGFFVLASKGAGEYPASNFAVLKYSNDGDLDSSFGENGLATGGIDTPVHFSALALTGDGSVVLAGNEPYDFHAEEDVIVARLAADGNLDPAFSRDGLATAGATGQRDAVVIEVEPLGGGKVLVLGRVRSIAGDEMVLAQYNVNGSLDKSFGRRGILKLRGFLYEYTTAMTLEPDGQIVVAGVTRTQRPSGGEDLIVRRFNRDGSPDDDFGTNGTAIGGDLSIYPADVEVQPDGKIVVGSSYGLGLNSTFGLARFDAGGTLDTDFGNGGRASADFPNNIDNVSDIVVQSDGKIVAVGASYLFTMPGEEWPPLAAIARFDTDGALDESFSEDGMLTFSNSGIAVAAHVNAKGKILVVTSGGRLLRLTPDGARDTKFGRNGRVRLDIDDARIINAAFDSRGDLVVLSNTIDDRFEVTGTFLTRFTRTGQRDESFGNDGVVAAKFSGAAIAIDEDADRLLFGGERNGRFAVARYLLD